MALTLCFGLFGCAEAGIDSTQSSNTESQNTQITEATNVTESTEATQAAETEEITEATITTAATEAATEATDVTTATEPVHTHTWQAATCSTPKTCSTCGATSGLTAGHTFSDGKCTACGKADPDYVQVTMVWIPTKGGTKYHSKKSCSGMDNPDHVTKSQAEQQGFTPCKKCYG
ncbi:MAG: hypothetical protein IKB80_05000 [Oscillospiraceae bacterium]|nr:hypothetical protein [Oscillospiraceae bacterium]